MSDPVHEGSGMAALRRESLGSNARLRECEKWAQTPLAGVGGGGRARPLLECEEVGSNARALCCALCVMHPITPKGAQMAREAPLIVHCSLCEAYHSSERRSRHSHVFRGMWTAHRIAAALPIR